MYLPSWNQSQFGYHFNIPTPFRTMLNLPWHSAYKWLSAVCSEAVHYLQGFGPSSVLDDGWTHNVRGQKYLPVIRSRRAERGWKYEGVIPAWHRDCQQTVLHLGLGHCHNKPRENGLTEKSWSVLVLVVRSIGTRLSHTQVPSIKGAYSSKWERLQLFKTHPNIWMIWCCEIAIDPLKR